MRRIVLMVAVLFVLLRTMPAHAVTWSVGVAPANSATSQAQSAPSAPAAPTATCVGLLSAQITVSWTAVPHATSYTVWVSTVSAAGPFTVLGSGAPASPWTTIALIASSYWFEVTATIGSNWTSAPSAVAGPRVILLSLACL